MIRIAIAALTAWCSCFAQGTWKTDIEFSRPGG